MTSDADPVCRTSARRQRLGVCILLLFPLHMSLLQGDSGSREFSLGRLPLASLLKLARVTRSPQLPHANNRPELRLRDKIA